MAFNTPNKFRAIQFLSDGHVSFNLPDASKSGSASGFDSLAEFAVAAGVYPILVTGAAAAIIKGMLIMLPGGFIGGVPALIIPEEPLQ